MKFLPLILIGALSSFSAFATNLETIFESDAMNKVCQKTARFTATGSIGFMRVSNADDKFIYLGLRSPNGWEVLIINRADMSEKSFKMESKVQNIQINNDEVLITTNDELYVVNKNDHSLIFKTRTLPAGTNSAKNARPYGVHKYKNVYYIAHGKYGVVPFDANKMKHLPAIMPIVPQPASQMTSMATDIVGIEEQVYIAFDNLSLHSRGRAFEGVMIFNLDTAAEEKIIPVKQSLEAYHMPNLTIDDDELIVTNYNLNFRHKLSSLTRAKYMKPLKRIWKYPLGNLVGRGIIKDKKIYGCFKDLNKKTISSGWMSLE